jgi:ABC-2 type transport system permease protein
MRAVLRIAGRDLRDAWRDRSAPAFAAVIVGLAIVSLAVGWAQYGRLAADQRAAQREAREQWLGQGEKNPHSAGHFGSFAFKTLPPLALLDRGIDRYLSQWVRL